MNPKKSRPVTLARAHRATGSEFLGWSSILQIITTDQGKLADALQWCLAHCGREQEMRLRSLQEQLRYICLFHFPLSQPIELGLSSDQLADASERCRYLRVRRPQLTWRLIGYAEALGLQIDELHAVVDAYPAGLRVFWSGEAQASIRAWREAEQRLGLDRRATHRSLPALVMTGSIAIGKL